MGKRLETEPSMPTKDPRRGNMGFGGGKAGSHKAVEKSQNKLFLFMVGEKGGKEE